MCSRYPIDVDGCLNVVPGTSICPIDVDAPSDLIGVDITFNVITGVNSRLTCHSVANILFPYIARVWLQAGLQLRMRQCRVVSLQPGVEPRAPGVEKDFCAGFFFDDQSHINVYIVPVISAIDFAYTVHGFDPIGGFTPPTFIVMAEGDGVDRFSFGRLANTLAHEIGHAFGLDHHPDNTFLMYAYAPGVEPGAMSEEKLSPGEINTVRHWAAQGPWAIPDYNGYFFRLHV